MFWPFLEINGTPTFCPLAAFGGQHVREGCDIYATAVVAQPLTAHRALHNADQAHGRIVLVERGRCDFVTKAHHAQAAGALALLVANTNREASNEAFVMDAGHRAEQQGESKRIHIPVLMVARVHASWLFETLRERVLDRSEFALTIRFLGAQSAAAVLEKEESSAHARAEEEKANREQVQRERQQREAAALLRSRLGAMGISEAPCQDASPPISSRGSDASSTCSPRRVLCMQSRQCKDPDTVSDDWMETLSTASTIADHHERCAVAIQSNETSAMEPWCPMTTALLVMDMQNYFTHPENAAALQPHTRGANNNDTSKHAGSAYYQRIERTVVPNLQDVLLACRACTGLEVLYSTVESATRDGRERSQAHKKAGLHITKGGFGAKVVARVAPSENDIVLPRSGTNIFEATNVDYVLRNLTVSHLVVVGVSILDTMRVCTQTALDRGYQVTLLRDAIACVHQDDALDEMLHHCERIGAQVTSVSAFVKELVGFTQDEQDPIVNLGGTSNSSSTISSDSGSGRYDFGGDQP